MRTSDKLRELARTIKSQIRDTQTTQMARTVRSVRLEKSFELEDAKDTAERMLDELSTCPDQVEILPGVMARFENGQPAPNFYPPNKIYLYYGSDRSQEWVKEIGKDWCLI